MKGLIFTPDENSNVLTTDGLATVTLTINDLGLSGEGGAQESEPLIISIVVSPVNDGPLLDLPDYVEAQEDVPLIVSGLSVSDMDSDEPGGNAVPTNR